MPGTELFGDEEKREIQDVLDTGILFRYNHEVERKNIWKARTFEKEFADYHNVNYCHFCSSGTAADIISLASCGIGAGDEVIVPPYTFIAPIESVFTVGAVPVFAEIDETLCLSPEGIKGAITPGTKAVLLVQMFGSMAHMNEIVKVCNDNNLILIEDAAPALGATYYGKPVGTFGNIGCFSFDFFKIITAGEGGAVITNDQKIYDIAHMYSDHGHDHIGNNRGAEQHPILGLNFRNSELHAAVGLAQFRKLDYIIEKQRANKKILQEAFEQFPGISFRDIPDENGDSATFFTFFLPDEAIAKKASEELNKEGVGNAYWYVNNFHYLRNWEHLKDLKSAYKLPLRTYGKIPDYNNINLPVTDSIMKRLLMIQIMVNWTENELSELTTKITRALRKVF